MSQRLPFDAAARPSRTDDPVNVVTTSIKSTSEPLTECDDVIKGSDKRNRHIFDNKSSAESDNESCESDNESCHSDNESCESDNESCQSDNESCQSDDESYESDDEYCGSGDEYRENDDEYYESEEEPLEFRMAKSTGKFGFSKPGRR